MPLSARTRQSGPRGGSRLVLALLLACGALTTAGQVAVADVAASGTTGPSATSGTSAPPATSGASQPSGVYDDAAQALRRGALYVHPSLADLVVDPTAGLLGDRFAKTTTPTRVAVLPADAAASDAQGTSPAVVLRDALSADLGPRSTYVVLTVTRGTGPGGGALIGQAVAVVGGATDPVRVGQAADAGAGTGRVDRALDVVADELSPSTTFGGRVQGLLGLPLLLVALGWFALRLARRRRSLSRAGAAAEPPQR